MVQTYDELEVIYDGNKVMRKMPTKRGQVRISEHTASVNNRYSKTRGLLYVLNKKASAEVDAKIKAKIKE